MHDKHIAAVEPSDIRSAHYAIELFGKNNVNVGVWTERIFVNNISLEEFFIGQELLAELGIKLIYMNKML